MMLRNWIHCTSHPNIHHVVSSSRGSICTSKTNYLKTAAISKGTSATFLRGELYRCAAERDQGTYQGRIYHCSVQRRMSLPQSHGRHIFTGFQRSAAAEKKADPERSSECIINFGLAELVLTHVAGDA
jgi:hypothetical protein